MGGGIVKGYDGTTVGLNFGSGKTYQNYVAELEARVAFLKWSSNISHPEESKVEVNIASPQLRLRFFRGVLSGKAQSDNPLADATVAAQEVENAQAGASGRSSPLDVSSLANRQVTQEGGDVDHSLALFVGAQIAQANFRWNSWFESRLRADLGFGAVSRSQSRTTASLTAEHPVQTNSCTDSPFRDAPGCASITVDPVRYPDLQIRDGGSEWIAAMNWRIMADLAVVQTPRYYPDFLGGIQLEAGLSMVLAEQTVGLGGPSSAVATFWDHVPFMGWIGGTFGGPEKRPNWSPVLERQSAARPAAPSRAQSGPAPAPQAGPRAPESPPAEAPVEAPAEAAAPAPAEPEKPAAAPEPVPAPGNAVPPPPTSAEPAGGDKIEITFIPTERPARSRKRRRSPARISTPAAPKPAAPEPVRRIPPAIVD